MSEITKNVKKITCHFIIIKLSPVNYLFKGRNLSQFQKLAILALIFITNKFLFFFVINASMRHLNNKMLKSHQYQQKSQVYLHLLKKPNGLII